MSVFKSKFSRECSKQRNENSVQSLLSFFFLFIKKKKVNLSWFFLLGGGYQLSWLERTPDKGEVAGSNPAQPTNVGKIVRKMDSFQCKFQFHMSKSRGVFSFRIIYHFGVPVGTQLEKEKWKRKKGVQLSWQSAALARQMPAVRVRLPPPHILYVIFFQV